MKIDLHNHTTYSDGLYTPEELLVIAKKQNIDILAITDHDSVFGCEEIQKLSIKYNIRVINGLELSTEYKKESVHIVCLFKNNEVPESFVTFSNNKKEERVTRAIKMMEAIKNIYGLKVDIKSLIEENEIVTRANMCYNIAKCNNISQKEAEPYVDKNSKAYIPSTNLSTEEGLRLAHEAGCITILAHPCLLPREYVEEIIKMGVDGLEVRYPKNKADDEEYFKSLTEKYNILASAGSDFHGDFGSKHAIIGTSTLSYLEFIPIMERLGLQWK